MRSIMLLLAIGFSAVAASPTSRIVAGMEVSIDQYPMAAAMLFSSNGMGTFRQTCGGTIVSRQAVISAAHCYDGHPVNRWRARVGSNRASSGGVLRDASRFVIHPQYNSVTQNNDIAVIRFNVLFNFNDNVRAATLGGVHNEVTDNQAVWAIGWGATSYGGQASENLRQVQIWAVRQSVCRENYASVGRTITDNMLCAGWINVGGRDQCTGDAGSPLLRNNVVVGIYSFGHQCGLPRFPGVNVRISRFRSWINTNSR